jgi:hypothetical protein
MKKLYLFLIMSSAHAIMADELPDIIRETHSGQKVAIPAVTYAVNKSLLALLKQEAAQEKRLGYESDNGLPHFGFYKFLDGFYCDIHPTRNGYSTFVVRLKINSTKVENHPIRKEFLQAIQYASKRFGAEKVKEDQQTKVSIVSLFNGVRYITIETYLSQEQMAVLLRELSN